MGLHLFLLHPRLPLHNNREEVTNLKVVCKALLRVDLKILKEDSLFKEWLIKGLEWAVCRNRIR